MTPPDPIELARTLASKLPAADIAALAQAAAGGPGKLRALRTVSGSFAMQRACNDALTCIGDGPGEFFAGALAGAAAALNSPDRGPELDVVWTGPHSAITTSRLTAATVVSLIDQARQEIILVSYATQSEESITNALTAAAARDVEITLLLERSADNPSYTSYSTPFPGIDAQHLAWPAEQREPGAALHAKVLVIDSVTALVGSANITQRAMDINLECGILIRGSDHPASIRSHVLSLRDQGLLRRLP